VDRGGGSSTEAAAKDVEWLRAWKQVEKCLKRPKASAVRHDEAELAVRVARELLTRRGSAKAATPAMSPPEPNPRAA
jgi:hypothetical protein